MMLEAPDCHECGDRGYVIIPGHECAGDDAVCGERCPVPVKAPCSRCHCPTFGEPPPKFV